MCVAYREDRPPLKEQPVRARTEAEPTLVDVASHIGLDCTARQRSAHTIALRMCSALMKCT